MHRFAKPPRRVSTAVKHGSGDPDRESGIPDRRRAPLHLRTRNRREGHLRIGFPWAGKRLRHSGALRARALAASLSGRRSRLRGKRPRATRFAGAGWQGARNVTELVCCVTNEKYRCFCGVFCVSGFPEWRLREPGKMWITARDRGCRTRRCTASRSGHVTLRHFATLFRQNCSYASAEFAKPFCFASSHGRSHCCVCSHHE
ncbi:hypothetical protein BLA50215_01159 [Burkholderia lata]|nr:hypothetical protein BLA50215_01159 [Burkholderia lata]